MTRCYGWSIPIIFYALLQGTSHSEGRSDESYRKTRVDVPIIDVSPLLKPNNASASAAAEEVVAAIGNAAIDTGFFYLAGYGVDPTLERRLMASAKAFFALPTSVKQRRLSMSQGGKAWRGYFAVGEELTSGVVDQKEGIYFGREGDLKDPRPMHGANLWPGNTEILEAIAGHWAGAPCTVDKSTLETCMRSENCSKIELAEANRRIEAATLAAEALGDMESAVTTWMAHMEVLGKVLMRAVFAALFRDKRGQVSGNVGRKCETRFHGYFENEPLTLFRIFNYPPNDSVKWGEHSWAVGEHSDYGFLTLLLQDHKGGLEARDWHWEQGSSDSDEDGKDRSASEGWIDVPPIEHTLVVNFGDALEHLTGGLVRATPHRVRPRINATNSIQRKIKHETLLKKVVGMEIDGDCDSSTNDDIFSGRLSFPFFFDPNWDAVMESAVPCLDRELRDRYAISQRASSDHSYRRWDGKKLGALLPTRAGESTSQTTTTYGEYVTSKVAKVFPELAKETELPGTSSDLVSSGSPGAEVDEL